MAAVIYPLVISIHLIYGLRRRRWEMRRSLQNIMTSHNVEVR